MKLRVFTLRLDPTTGVFDDADMTQFLADKEALTVHEHFLTHDGVPTWALLVSYREAAHGPLKGGDRRPRTDWRGELEPSDQPVFDALRRWRNDKAVRDGRPAYVLLTNRQLYEVVRRRPDSLAALGEIEGVGPARVEGFGEELLEVLRVAHEA